MGITSGNITTYHSTRNGLLGHDFSTKLSAYLALGCLTARQIHSSLLSFEDGTSPSYSSVSGYGAGQNDGTKSIRFELLWRDYMRLCTRKFGPKLFRLSGFKAEGEERWNSPSRPSTGSSAAEVKSQIERFLNGTTGMGLIDASLREMYHTGYTSNRARQNVASFLAKHLKIDWRIGAEWYESMLVDYDLSSNWGNWQYLAGVGNDPRGEARIFNPVKQAFDYDPNGDYVKAWVPELRDLTEPAEIFQAWTVREERRKEVGLEGLDWVESPLLKINFTVNRRGRHPGRSRMSPSPINRKINLQQRTLHPIQPLQTNLLPPLLPDRPRLKDLGRLRQISQFRHPSLNIIAIRVIIKRLLNRIEDPRFATRIIAYASEVLPITPVGREVVVHEHRLVPLRTNAPIDLQMLR